MDCSHAPGSPSRLSKRAARRDLALEALRRSGGTLTLNELAAQFPSWGCWVDLAARDLQAAGLVRNTYGRLCILEAAP